MGITKTLMVFLLGNIPLLLKNSKYEGEKGIRINHRITSIASFYPNLLFPLANTLVTSFRHSGYPISTLYLFPFMLMFPYPLFNRIFFHYLYCLCSTANISIIIMNPTQFMLITLPLLLILFTPPTNILPESPASS